MSKAPVVHPSLSPDTAPTSSSGVDRAMLALAEAIIPGTSTIPAADDTTVREVAALVARLSPRLSTAWTAAHRALDAGARLRTGRPFHALSAACQQALLLRWQRDPLFKTPLSLISSVYKIVHFDAPHVQRALGAVEASAPGERATVDAAGPRRRFLDRRGRGSRRGGGGHRSGWGRWVTLAARGHAVVFVEEGQLYHRHSFDGSTVRAYERFYRPVFALGNASFPIFVGRMVGGSTAVNGGTAFRTPSRVLDRWCEETGSDASPRPGWRRTSTRWRRTWVRAYPRGGTLAPSPR